MSNIELLEKTLPAAPLKLIAMESCRELGQKVNDYIVSFFVKIQSTKYPNLLCM